ncbi:MAG: Rid family detoxifying hydrolase [Acidobacteriota bacterium]
MTIRPEVVCTSRAPAAIGPYSQALRLGPWIFLSGQIALHPESGKLIDGGVGEQARRCMENARAVLRAADADFTDVIRAILYLRDMGDFEEVNRVYGEYFPERPPVRSAVQVAGLPRGAAVEIELTAYREK